MSFKVGDSVMWTSQSAGCPKTKVGTVAEVVPPKGYPSREQFPRLYKHSGVGLYRDHESYVVLVGKKPYWPRVIHLKAAITAA